MEKRIVESNIFPKRDDEISIRTLCFRMKDKWEPCRIDIKYNLVDRPLYTDAPFDRDEKREEDTAEDDRENGVPDIRNAWVCVCTCASRRNGLD